MVTSIADGTVRPRSPISTPTARCGIAAVTTTSADGLSVTTQSDIDRRRQFDQTRTDVTVLNADGSRTETVTDTSATARCSTAT